MISLINIPCDSPVEFYQSSPLTANSMAKKADSIKTGLETIMSTNLLKQSKRKIQYLPDGRKLMNGKVLEDSTAPKLWEQLLHRSIVQKIEEQIQSPVTNSLAKTKTKFSFPEKVRSQSTFSLISQELLDEQCAKCSIRKFKAIFKLKSKNSTIVQKHIKSACSQCNGSKCSYSDIEDEEQCSMESLTLNNEETAMIERPTTLKFYETSF